MPFFNMVYFILLFYFIIHFSNLEICLKTSDIWKYCYVVVLHLLPHGKMHMTTLYISCRSYSVVLFVLFNVLLLHTCSYVKPFTISTGERGITFQEYYFSTWQYFKCQLELHIWTNRVLYFTCSLESSSGNKKENHFSLLWRIVEWYPLSPHPFDYCLFYFISTSTCLPALTATIFHRYVLEPRWII